MSGETTLREAVQVEKSPLTRVVPGYDAKNAFLTLFGAAFQEAYTNLSEASLQLRENKWQSLVAQLVRNCFASGLPQGEAVKHTVFHSYMYGQEVLIREMTDNVYLECRGFDKNINLNKERQLAL